jgi:hypothetical protein
LFHSVCFQTKMDKTPPRKATFTQKPPPIVRKKAKCQGCIENQPNQQAHMGGNGCLPDWDESKEEFDVRKAR